MVSGPASSPQATVLVGPLDGTELDGATAVTTDSEGGAAVRIRLGYTAGSGGIVITVPTTGYQDTVLCQVRPGAPSAVEVSPLDSAAFVGGGLSLNTRVLDRAWNVRADPV
jgi:hypothetical protein